MHSPIPPNIPVPVSQEFLLGFLLKTRFVRAIIHPQKTWEPNALDSLRCLRCALGIVR